MSQPTHTFTVTNHEEPLSEWAKKRLDYQADWITGERDHHTKIRGKMKGTTVYASPADTMGGYSPLFSAISLAFNQHYPLVLDPNAVWLTIQSGLGHHIDTDPEGLRHHFVQHEGQAKIEIKTRGAFRSVDQGGFRHALNLFSEKIKDYIGKKHDLMVADFSTTTEVDRMASQVSMMGALKHYFQYGWTFACGLADVQIMGTPDDWASIHQRVMAMSEFNLQWWTDRLAPVVDQIRLACEGKPEIDFWKRVYLRQGKGSGGQSDVTGWVNTFYPYIPNDNASSYGEDESGVMQRNPYVDWENNKGTGVDADAFPPCLSCAPLDINDNGITRKAEFYGGLVGVNMSPKDYAVKPVSGVALQEVE
jgi:hypothetical protein